MSNGQMEMLGNVIEFPEREVVDYRRGPPPVDTGFCGCRGYGIIIARHRENGCRYAFRCGCWVGRQDRRAYQQWDSGLLSTYEVLA